MDGAVRSESDTARRFDGIIIRPSEFSLGIIRCIYADEHARMEMDVGHAD